LNKKTSSANFLSKVGGPLTAIKSHSPSSALRQAIWQNKVRQFAITVSVQLAINSH